MVGPIRTFQLPAVLGAVVILLAGCGTAVERGADDFRREHGAEARRAATAIGKLSAGVAALGANPSKAQLESVAVQQHLARRQLLAATSWEQVEDSEEEGVSQAEREIHEAAGELLEGDDGTGALHAEQESGGAGRLSSAVRRRPRILEPGDLPALAHSETVGCPDDLSRSPDRPFQSRRCPPPGVRRTGVRRWASSPPRGVSHP